MRNITAVTDSYVKNGKSQAVYTKIGVMGTKNGKDYIILDANVSLSGVLMSQRDLAHQEGRKLPTSVMCGVYDQNRGGQNG